VLQIVLIVLLHAYDHRGLVVDRDHVCKVGVCVQGVLEVDAYSDDFLASSLLRWLPRRGLL
jgi:hypothetical protein